MKNRNASTAERATFYLISTGVLIVSIVVISFIFKNYSQQKTSIEEQKLKLSDEKTKLEADINSLKSSLVVLDTKMEKKLKDTDIEKNQYEEILKKLNDAKNYLPKSYIKPQIMNSLLEKAKEENLNVIYFEQKKMEFINIDLDSITFEMEVEGDYFRIKNFLFFLEKPLVIPDEFDHERMWNVILKIPYPNGLKFYRYFLKNTAVKRNDDDEDYNVILPDVFYGMINDRGKIVIEEANPDYNPAQNNRSRAKSTAPKTIKRTVININGIRELLKENDSQLLSFGEDMNLRLKIQIKTFFVKDRLE